MAEKNDNKWEKFLTGDSESSSNSPVSNTNSTKNTEASIPPAEKKESSNAPETLEEKIARVMAGINMPKKGTSVAKPKASVPIVEVSEEKLPDTPTNSPTENIIDAVEQEKSSNSVDVIQLFSPTAVNDELTTPDTTNDDTENFDITDATHELVSETDVSHVGVVAASSIGGDQLMKLANTEPSVDQEEDEVQNAEDNNEYEHSDDDEPAQVVMTQPCVDSQPTSAAATATSSVNLEDKMTLSDLEEFENIVSQVGPPDSNPPQGDLPLTDSSNHTTAPTLSSQPPSQRKTITSIKPGTSTRVTTPNNYGHSSAKQSTLSGHLSANRSNKPLSSSGGSVGSGSGNSHNTTRTTTTSSSSFAPQPRRLPTVKTSLGGNTDSLPSPDHSKSRNNGTPWSITARFANDTQTPPSPGKSVSSTTGTGEHRVTVAVRIRPFMVGEIQQGPRRVVSVNGDKLILVNPNAFDADPDTIAAAAAAVSLENMRCNDWAKVFCFDHCLWSYDPTDTEDIYVDEEGIFEAVGLNIVGDITRGISSCCFAYGHTGTGKTHTMLGDAKNGSYIGAHDVHGLRLIESAGLAPRVFLEVVERILNDPETSQDTKITISFLEIYQEKLRDCLVAADNSADLKVREHPALGPYVENLQKIEVKSPEDALALLYQGYCERSTGQNSRNRLSSRSHAVVTLELTSSNAPDPFLQVSSKNNQPSTIHRQEHVRLQMVDLAGSEKESSEDKADAFSAKKGVMTPQRGANIGDGSVEKMELKMIRRSLSTLGYIIKTLGNGLKGKGLPFRDSLLTWLLKDSFMCKSNTTMLATISPSHTCFDETLSTLKYAERLCHLGASSTPGQENSSRVSIRDTIDPQLSYTLATEFSRLKRELGSDKHGSHAARQLLQQTLSDPQQRLARMDPYHSNTVEDSKEYAPNSRKSLGDSGNYSRINRTIEANSSYNHNRPPRGSQSTSSSTSMSKSHSHSEHGANGIGVDLDLKEAYRQLHGKYVELQIELENARTDRDGMQLERQHMQEELDRAKSDRYATTSHNDTVGVTAALREAESEVGELRGVVLRKEEACDRLLSELAEERKARDVVEQTARAQVTELIKRLEALHKQGQEALQKSDTWQSSAETLQSDKEKLEEEVTSLRDEMLESKKETKIRLENITMELELSVKQYATLVEERDRLHTEMATMSNEKAQMTLRESSLSERNQSLQIDLEKATNDSKVKSELEIVKLQRDSLYEIINQQEQEIQVHQQQSEASLKMLHQRQEALDRYEQKSGGDMDELTAIQNSLHKMLVSEGELLQSELIDARKMTEVMSTVKERVQEARVMKDEIARIQIERTQLQESVDRLSQEKKTTTENLKASNDQIDSLKKLAVDWESRTHYWEQIAQKNSADNEKNKELEAKLKSSEELAISSENARLRELLDISQREAASAKAELESSKEDMQKEFSSLWLAVEQLNKLDATKDKAMTELTDSYDEACAKNVMWEGKYKAIVADYDKLQRELQAIDLDLLDKADIEGIEVSSLLNHTFSPSRNARQSGGASRSISKPRSSSRSRSPPGRRASHGGESSRSRSHSNQRARHGHGLQNSSNPAYGFTEHAFDSPSDIYSIQSASGTSKRNRDYTGPTSSSASHSGGLESHKSDFVRRNQMKPDKRMSEKGLEEQIVELSQFLEHDSERLQSQQVRSRMRVSTNSSRSVK